MTKHTPGPWSVIEHNWSDTGIFTEPKAGERMEIASLSLDESDYEEDSEESQEKCEGDQLTQLANARLIAAAPDLLAALIELHEWYKGEYQSNPVINARVDAAIAKARGE